MANRDAALAAQALLASAGYSPGPLDGIAGRQTWAAVAAVERNDAETDVSGWSEARRLWGAAQRVLNAQGYEAGDVDGYAGHNTLEAYRLWRAAQAGKPETVERHALDQPPDPGELPRQRDCAAFYGDPARGQVAGRLGWATPPATLRLDWALEKTVSRLRVHQLAAPSLEAALTDVIGHYGVDEWRRLGLDRYAGGYNHRRMRGGSKWSMHAYGCAVDFYAAPNGLRTRCPKALFCGPVYRPFLDIMEAHGWLPAIRLWGADAMHFQRARL